MTCPLCVRTDEVLVWDDPLCRVIAVADDDYPGFCRVVWQHHVAEMSDLAVPAQRHLLNVVLATEIALRKTMQPHKINLASLGNVVPHLHWHVIPRFTDDRHFPQPIWGVAQRESSAHRPAPDRRALGAAIGHALAELTAG